MKRLIKTGAIVRRRPKGGKMTVSIPEIQIPHFIFGDNGEGVSRGPGKEGDVIGRDPDDGKGSNAGEDPGEGINITVDMEDLLKLIGENLRLPDMKPKPNEVFEEVHIKYNDISKVGPESLRHTRRTITEAIKRLAAIGELEKLHKVPSSKVPIRLITPINSDRRYRQYKEIRVPSSNAVIFFARDCSGSMDDYRCDIVSDMSWWLDTWIRRFYKKVDRAYYVHDTRAQEVNEEEFYTYRYGGGTMCSSAFKIIAEQLEHRYPPSAYNIYIFYFTDGENWGGDNEKMTKVIQEKLGSKLVNLIGITQVCPWRYQNSVKHYIDEAIESGSLSNVKIRTTGIGSDAEDGEGVFGWGYRPNLSEEDRNSQIIDGIRRLLSEERTTPSELLLSDG